MNIKDFSLKALKKMHGLFPSEAAYLKARFRLQMGYKLNLDDPKTYSEKVQWLKLYNRKPEYVTMVDKYAVKEYVGKILGEEYIIPNLGVWASPEDIEWDILPDKFVLKTTHGGGGYGVIVCKDKSQLDKAEAVALLKGAMNQDMAKYSGEWMYGQVPRRILAEELLEEDGKVAPDDYKVLCFDGEAKLIEYHKGRGSDNHSQDFYDRDWNLTDITQDGYCQTTHEVSPKPALLDKMLEYSEKLCKGIPHLRVDWYLVKDRLYFGEITFFDGSGFEPWDRIEDELMMGSWIHLPNR